MEIFDFWVDPELWCLWESAVFDGFVVAGNLFFDAVDLVDVNMSIIRDEGKLAWAGADTLRYEVTENGVLSDIKR